MIAFNVFALIGTVMMVCGLVYEQRRSPYTWLIGALAVWYTGHIIWHVSTDWLRDFTVVN